MTAESNACGERKSSGDLWLARGCHEGLEIYVFCTVDNRFSKDVVDLFVSTEITPH